MHILKIKAFLIIITSFFSLQSIAQHVALGDSVSIILPSGSKKLNKEQLLLFADKKYDVRVISFNPKNVYQINDMLLALYDFKGISKETNLNERKKGLDGMHNRAGHLNPHYYSIIQNVNNNKVLISKNVNNDIMTYSFSYTNNIESLTLNGIFQFNKVDSAKASATLDKMINSIKLKE